MNRKGYMTVLFLAWQLVLQAQLTEVGLFRDDLVERAVVYISTGDYRLEAADEVLTELMPGDILYVSLDGGSVHVLDAGRDYGLTDKAELVPVSTDATIRVRSLQPERPSRVYDDGLRVKAGDRYLDLVNMVDMDKYLAGVVETETGPNAEKEFYKAQAVLCRTYALKHMDRHRSEGFSLCDGTHCQSYRGKSMLNPQILEAVEETTGMIAADYNFRLITAAYHSNSGGQTQRARDVWLQDVDYLQSVIDPYSLNQPHAKWQDTISFRDWKAYLLKNGMKSVGRIPDEIIYIEQMRRKKYFVLDQDSLAMTKIREDWGFKSAFFDMFPEGDSVLIWGKGYGHGVGMSQEGAMKMARDGFLYSDILQFYFTGIRLMDYRDLPHSSLPVGIPDQ
jgi:stage II sporulation protein D